MNENQIADIWMMFKEYLDKKNYEAAAERYIELLVDHGINDKTLQQSIGFEDVLDEAIEYYLADDVTDDEDDYDEDNWDFDED